MAHHIAKQAECPTRSNRTAWRDRTGDFRDRAESSAVLAAAHQFFILDSAYSRLESEVGSRIARSYSKIQESVVAAVLAMHRKEMIALKNNEEFDSFLSEMTDICERELLTGADLPSAIVEDPAKLEVALEFTRLQILPFLVSRLGNADRMVRSRVQHS